MLSIPLESYMRSEEDDESGNMNRSGRLSSVHNEDDYDYALVLMPDDEYRKAAKVVGNISDFGDADEYIENLLFTDKVPLGFGEGGGEDDDDYEDDLASVSTALIPGEEQTYKGQIAKKKIPMSITSSADAEADDGLSPRKNKSQGSSKSGKNSNKNKSKVTSSVEKDNANTATSSSFYQRLFGWGGVKSANGASSSPTAKAHDSDEEQGIAASSSNSKTKAQSSHIGEINSPLSKMKNKNKNVLSGTSVTGSPSTYVSPFASPIRGISSPPDETLQSSGATTPIMSNDSTVEDHSNADEEEPDELTVSQAIEVISRRQLLTRIGVLASKKKWVEKAARRSSMGFESKYAVTDKAVMDAFTIAMHAGVHVRRHQGSKTSEIVKLSSSDGCRSLQWGSAVPEEFAFQRQKEGIVIPKEDKYARMAAKSHSYAHSQETEMPGSTVWDCCGLDDDVDDSSRHRYGQERSVKYNQNVALGAGSSKKGEKSNLKKAIGKKVIEEEKNPDDEKGMFFNFGFRYTGGFSDIDIITVHPACKGDPTAVGSNGTEELRSSKDTYNSALTFSIVLRTTIRSPSGYITLDLECEAEETYCLLVQGFNLLCAEASIREASRFLSMKSTADSVRDGAHATLEGGRAVWEWAVRNGMDYLRPLPMNDPVRDLFEAPSGGLLKKLGLSSTADSDPGFTMRAAQTLATAKLRESLGSNNSEKTSSSESSASSKMHIDKNKDMYASKSDKDVENGSSRDSTGSSKSSINPLLPPAQFLGWHSAGTQIWARLKMAGLEVKVSFSWDLGRVLLKIRCPQWRLEEVAEFMHLKLRNRDGTIRRFKVSRRDTFVPDGSTISLFRSSERQCIIDYIIRSKIKDGGAELGEDTILGGNIVQRFPLHMQARMEEIRHTWVTFWREEPAGVIAKPWSPCSTPLRVTCRRMWYSIKYIFKNLLIQPLDSIAEYYGESVAFYFAYLTFYTRWLIPPSVLGFLVFCFQVKDMQLDHWMCLPYSVLVMIWTCFLLVFWRQRSASLAYRWGVLDYENQETERPQFRGKRYVDKDTMEIRKYYPTWKRVLKYAMSVPVLLTTFVAMLAIMSTVFTTQDRVLLQYQSNQPITYWPQITMFNGIKDRSWNENRRLDGPAGVDAMGGTISDKLSGAKEYAKNAFSIHIDTDELKDPDFWAVTFFYPSLYGMITNILSALFNVLAIRINDYENHRTQSEYTNHLVLKIIIFRFTAVFLALYYYAFFSYYDTAQSYMRMSVTIFSMMTAGQWTGAFIDIAVPAIMHRFWLYRLSVQVSTANKKLYKAKEFADERKHKLWLREQRKGKKDEDSSRTDSSSSLLLTLPLSTAGTHTNASSVRSSGSSCLNDQGKDENDDSQNGDPSVLPIELSLDSYLPVVDLEAGEGIVDKAPKVLTPLRPSLSATFFSRLSSIRLPSFGGGTISARTSAASTVTGTDTTASSILDKESEKKDYWGISSSTHYNGRSRPRASSGVMLTDAELLREKQACKVLDETISRRAKYLQSSRSKCWDEALMERYRSFTDYSTSIVQLGFVVFFSPVFPLAPLIALINNLCLIRLNAFKMCYTRQRPIAAKTGGIGVWEDVLQIMSVIAIVTNCCLMGLTSAQLRSLIPNWNDMTLAVGLFLLEHVLLLFKYWLHSAVPRLPLSVHRAQAREQLQREQYIRDRQRRRSNRGGGGRNKSSSGSTSGGTSRKGEEFDDDDDIDMFSNDPESAANSPVPPTNNTNSDPDERPIRPMDARRWSHLEEIDDQTLDTRAALSPITSKKVRFAETEEMEAGGSIAAGSSKKGAYRRSSMCVRSKIGSESGDVAKNNAQSYNYKHTHKNKNKGSDSDNDNSDTSSDSNDDEDDADNNQGDEGNEYRVLKFQMKSQPWKLESSPYNANSLIRKTGQSQGLGQGDVGIIVTGQPVGNGNEWSSISSSSSSSSSATASLQNLYNHTANAVSLLTTSTQNENGTGLTNSGKMSPTRGGLSSSGSSNLQRAPSWDPSSFLEKLGQIRKAAEPSIRPHKQPSAKERRLAAAASAASVTGSQVAEVSAFTSVLDRSERSETGKPEREGVEENESDYDDDVEDLPVWATSSTIRQPVTVPIHVPDPDHVLSAVLVNSLPLDDNTSFYTPGQDDEEGDENESYEASDVDKDENIEVVEQETLAPLPVLVPVPDMSVVLTSPRPPVSHMFDERPVRPNPHPSSALSPFRIVHSAHDKDKEKEMSKVTAKEQDNDNEKEKEKTPLKSSRIGRGLASASKVLRGAAVTATATATAAVPSVSITDAKSANVKDGVGFGPGSLDDKMRTINALVKGAVTFVDSVAASRTGTPGCKSNPFGRILGVAATATANTSDNSAITEVGVGESVPSAGVKAIAASLSESVPLISTPKRTLGGRLTRPVGTTPVAVQQKDSSSSSSLKGGKNNDKEKDKGHVQEAPLSPRRGIRAPTASTNITSQMRTTANAENVSSLANESSSSSSGAMSPKREGGGGIPRATKSATLSSKTAAGTGMKEKEKEKEREKAPSSNPFHYAIE